MKKKNMMILITIMVALVIVLIGCICLGVFTTPNYSEGKTVGVSDKAGVYTDAYIEYSDNNPEAFCEGIILCDINGDDIPELFSIHGTQTVSALKYYQLKDGKVSPYTEFDNLLFDTALITEPATFHEDCHSFAGLYKNRNTGERVLISSCVIESDSSENSRRDENKLAIISFDGENMTVSDGIEESVKSKNSDDVNLDEIMANYELIDGGLYYAYSQTGVIDNPRESLYSLITKFEGGSGIVYGRVDNGGFYCYVKDVNLTDGKAVLVPAQEISFKEYSEAMAGNRVLKVNNESMSIQPSEDSDVAAAILYAEQGRTYTLNIPTEDKPKSVVEDYRKKRPVKVDINDETIVRYGIVDYDENDVPLDYKTNDKESEYTLSDYMNNYSEYSMGGYYKAVIKEGKLQYLDVIYKK